MTFILYMFVGACGCHNISEQLVGVGLPFPPCGSWGQSLICRFDRKYLCQLSHLSRSPKMIDFKFCMYTCAGSGLIFSVSDHP